jgi:hypothetical protein
MRLIARRLVKLERRVGPGPNDERVLKLFAALEAGRRRAAESRERGDQGEDFLHHKERPSVRGMSRVEVLQLGRERARERAHYARIGVPEAAT